MSARSLIALTSTAALLAACGGGGDASTHAARGSSANPLVGKKTALTADGRSNEAAAATGTTAESGGAATSGSTTTATGAAPRSADAASSTRTAPCRLVSSSQARTILGAPVQAPLLAPQGPTCIYRTKSGKGFVTVAVQSTDLASLTQRMRRPARSDIGRHPAYCGTYGQPMLYAQIARGWVLSVAAPCTVARRFAVKALGRLDA